LFPQVLLNVKLQPGRDWTANQKLASEIRDAQAALGETGRVLIRASGTEPLLRVMVEALDEGLATEWAQRLVKAAQIA
jgi:phosphoglucosamine mutase